MNLQNAPEVADGGYWYLVDSVPDLVLGGQTPGNIAGDGWCAWYNSGLVAVRCPEPVSGLQAQSQSAASVLTAAGYSGRPRGRVGGE